MTRVALVTGIAGQTGSYLAENLVAHGWKVHGLVRPGDESLRDLGLTLDADLHDQDLVDAAGVASLVERLEPDTIFHLGGLTGLHRDDPRLGAAARRSGRPRGGRRARLECGDLR